MTTTETDLDPKGLEAAARAMYPGEPIGDLEREAAGEIIRAYLGELEPVAWVPMSKVDGRPLWSRVQSRKDDPALRYWSDVRPAYVFPGPIEPPEPA